jgi:hypothetical protein
MFIAALVTKAKLWNQSKCPSTDEWIKNIYIHIYVYTHTHTHIYIYIHIYNGVLFSHEEQNVIYRKMDGFGDYHVK